MDDDTTIPSTLPEHDAPHKADSTSKDHSIVKILLVGVLLLVVLWLFKR